MELNTKVEKYYVVKVLGGRRSIVLITECSSHADSECKIRQATEKGIFTVRSDYDFAEQLKIDAAEAEVLKMAYGVDSEIEMPKKNRFNAVPEYNAPVTRSTFDNDTGLFPDTPKVEPKEQAKNFSSGVKPDYVLVPHEGIKLVSEAFTYGKKKYGALNWTKGTGIPADELISKALRHINQFVWDDQYDSESKLCHIGHALASLMMLAHNRKHKPKTLDNLPSKSNKGD